MIQWPYDVDNDRVTKVLDDADIALKVKIEIIKHIVAVKLAEAEAAEKTFAKKAQKQKIMSIIAMKENEALQNSSIEDLQKMLGELDD